MERVRNSSEKVLELHLRNDRLLTLKLFFPGVGKISGKNFSALDQD